MTKPVALVTGGSRGIGRAIVERLAASHRIAFTYRRDSDAAAEVVESVAAQGGTAMCTQADLTDLREAGRIVAWAEESLGSISVLVGNAGAASRGKSTVESPDDEYLRMFALFTVSNVALARAAITSLRANAGSIVYISSTVTDLLPAGTAPYAAGKAALDAAVAVMAREERDFGVRVNLVAPGLVATDMGDKLALATSGENSAASLDSRSPLGQVCRPGDVADAVAYLVSNQASYVNGHRLVVDGGGPNQSLVP
ncbi:SDR family NAD(P)-dependent oxidoreductase [Gordonia rubripertincta]|uniref:SDR family oxidoreductase n=1 Tax=Gordonia rubripertincta TaxID=36822 RepID=A0ABT4MWP9_GORRU|nr:SDR family oxidoreductase [Gordonia rubripertincta]MCZ4551443.1 SDR family oxidoreductase [Gordonia rubripertincta]